MKAIVYTEYGDPDVLQLRELVKPIPKDKEILIKVFAVSVNYGDIIARNFKNISLHEFNMPFLFYVFARFGFGFCKPKKRILGNTFAGVVEITGKDVTGYKKGDSVFGYTGEDMGTYAEYLCINENGILSEKPLNITYEEASAIPYGTLMALNLLRKANLKKGQTILILGASGSIGSAAIQLAKNYYGVKVTAACSLQSNEIVLNLGADRVINYKNEDLTLGGETYDLIFDVLGKESFSHIRKSLQRNGIYYSVSFKTKKLLQMLWTSLVGEKKVICALANPKPEDLILVKKLIEEGKIKSIIDKCFSLEQTAEAHKYVEGTVKKGSVVLTINSINS